MSVADVLGMHRSFSSRIIAALLVGGLAACSTGPILEADDLSSPAASSGAADPLTARAFQRVGVGPIGNVGNDALVSGGTQVLPQNRPVTPFGYGVVKQTLTSVVSPPLTGQGWCQQAFGAGFNCVSVSGGHNCNSAAPAGELVSCNQALVDEVNESSFAPVACNGHADGTGGWSPLLGNLDWCLIANYMPSRLTDAFYQYNDYVRLGVNRTFGGTIFELYGTDKIDRIMQNGGGAVQLSLWGDPPKVPVHWFLVSGDSQSCNPTGYDSEAACAAANPNPKCTSNATSGDNPLDCCQWGADGVNVDNCTSNFGCSGNGWSAGGPFNPIQAQSESCDYGTPPAQVDAVTSGGTGLLTVSKTGPYNFTKSDAFAGLTWTQTSRVNGPYAQVDYDMTYSGADSLGPSDQEIPAIFTHAGIGTSVYYYNGSKAYADGAGAVTHVTAGAGDNLSFVLPGATMKVGGTPIPVTENWASVCDSTEKQCITVATFSAPSQVIAFGYGADGSYMGIHGNFPIAPGMKEDARVYMFPYRFDDVVLGHTIREWIYSLHANAPYNGQGYAEPTNGNIDGLVNSGSTVNGWACRLEDPNPVSVQVYAGDPNAGGALIAKGTDSFPNEPAVGSACNSTGTSLRFQVAIPPAAQKKYAGYPIYVTAAGTTTPISSSGKFTIPGIYAKGFELLAGDRASIQGAMLTLQPADGNLVVYSSGGAALWASNGKPGFKYQDCTKNNCTASFQGDGNFVLYNSGTPYWDSGSQPSGAELLFSSRAPYLQIVDANGSAVWTSSSSN